MEAPIRPFYCVYLLRSTRRRASMYIGSTPDPRRRLKQHNNVSGKGGAHRTTKNSNLQPWDMVVTVTGFPSKTAALQFEWAWQHPHLTRHFSKEERVNVITTETKRKTKKGTERRRLAKPAQSMQANILNLYSLLSVESFNRWPLDVRFFAKDVFELWQKWSGKEPRPIRKGMKIQLDDIAREELADTTQHMNQPPCQRGIEAFDVTYASIKPHLTKSINLLNEKSSLACVGCQKELSPTCDLILVCPAEACTMTSHMSCLAQRFLREEGSESHILPTRGYCPSCKTQLSWSDLVTDLSLRTRGQHALKNLMKDPKRKSSSERKSAHEDATMLAPVSEVLLGNSLNDQGVQMDDFMPQNIDDDDLFDDLNDEEIDNLSDVLGENSDEDDDHPKSIQRFTAPNSMKRQEKSNASNVARESRIVISDSEYDDIDDITD